MAKRDPCSADSRWELPGCSSPELSRGKFKSRAEFASVRSLVQLQPSVFKSVGVSVLRFSSCCNSRADIPLVIANTLTDSIIDNAVTRLRHILHFSQGGCDFRTDGGAFRAVNLLVPVFQQLHPALSLFKICS